MDPIPFIITSYVVVLGVLISLAAISLSDVDRKERAARLAEKRPKRARRAFVPPTSTNHSDAS